MNVIYLYEPFRSIAKCLPNISEIKNSNEKAKLLGRKNVYAQHLLTLKISQYIYIIYIYLYAIASFVKQTLRILFLLPNFVHESDEHMDTAIKSGTSCFAHQCVCSHKLLCSDEGTSSLQRTTPVSIVSA